MPNALSTWPTDATHDGVPRLKLKNVRGDIYVRATGKQSMDQIAGVDPSQKYHRRNDDSHEGPYSDGGYTRREGKGNTSGSPIRPRDARISAALQPSNTPRPSRQCHLTRRGHRGREAIEAVRPSRQ